MLEISLVVDGISLDAYIYVSKYIFVCIKTGARDH